MRKNVLFCIILSRAMVLPLKNGSFLAKFSPLQKKALYVRSKGIPEGVILIWGQSSFVLPHLVQDKK